MICIKARPAISFLTGRLQNSLFFCLLLLPLLTNCASITDNQTVQQSIYTTPAPLDLGNIHSPAFIINQPEKQYNLIGTPSAQLKDQEPVVYVDPAQPTVYFESQTFSTNKNSYKNLIYRIHFSKVPFNFTELHLTTGKNPGILIIYTLDQEDRILLITTVHSCGCYLAFFPTDHLPQEAYPKDWPEQTQDVYGYTLPSLLDLDVQPESGKVFFTLESGNHRISNAEYAQVGQALHDTHAILMKMAPLSTLYHLPMQDTAVSFFEERGSRKGYVKNNLKILERLLISWWAFDLRVGEDKAYGKDDNSAIPLYTSLKFWQRKSSDLKDFPGFLSYWGWGL